MITLKSFLRKQFRSGTGEGRPLFDPTTGEAIAETSTEGLDMKAAVKYAREVGGPNLRALTFDQRGVILKALSKAIYEAREELIEVSIVNAGNTRSDAKFDIDGASGTLSAYSHYAKELAGQKVLVEGAGEPLLRAARFCGYHIQSTRPGVAVHINAFNFPVWGMAEKMASSILAGVPVITKPATSTALIAFRAVEKMVAADVLPEGAFQFVCGDAQDLLDHLGAFDHLAFTGSARVGKMLRSKANLLDAGTRVNIEADSLNAVVLAPDVDLSSENYGAFLRHVEKEVVQKAGQKCTATRRIFVPRDMIEEVQRELIPLFESMKVGSPRDEGVRVGPLTTASQQKDARAGLKSLVDAGAKVVFGGRADFIVENHEAGYFVEPALLRVDDMSAVDCVHDLEVFAPAATLIAYDRIEEAVAGVARGGGSLVSTVYTDDQETVTDLALAIAPYNGRVVIGSNKVADAMIHPGMVLPASVHGGPGRAGGGEELGGLRGLEFYMQRSAVQGDRGMLDRALGLR